MSLEESDLILAVDDHEENLQMLQISLRGTNLKMITANSGDEALQKLESFVPDLILMDINMPGIDGFETTMRIKEMPRHSHIPVLFLSAIKDANNIVKCFESGGVDYVSKPFRRKELLARIQTHLNIKHLQQRLTEERKRITSILDNILPVKVVEQLKLGKRPPSELYENVVIMFSDFKNFTILSKRMGPETAIGNLNQLFYAFDEIVAHYGLERIKTIGDGYMVVGGINTPATGAPLRMVAAVLQMQKFLKVYNGLTYSKYWELRAGAHVGNVIAGIIGFQRISFDIWGDAVNLASRIENASDTKGITVTKDFYDNIKEHVSGATHTKKDLMNIGDVELVSIEALSDTLPPEIKNLEETIDHNAIIKRFETDHDFIQRIFGSSVV